MRHLHRHLAMMVATALVLVAILGSYNQAPPGTAHPDTSAIVQNLQPDVGTPTMRQEQAAEATSEARAGTYRSQARPAPEQSTRDLPNTRQRPAATARNGST